MSVATTDFARVLLGSLLASDDMNTDIARAAHEVVHDRSMQDLEPPRARGFADDDVRDVVLAGELYDIVGDQARLGRDGDRLSPQAFGQPQSLRDVIPFFLVELEAASGFDAQCHPRRVQAVCQTLRVAHE